MVRKEGQEGFAAMLDRAQPLSDFFFEHFTSEVDMSALDGRARLVGLARPALESIPPGVFRDMMFSRLEDLARHRLEKTGTEPRRQARPAFNSDRPAQHRTPMRMALAHLVQNPALAQSVREFDGLEGCDLPGYEIYRELVDFCAKSPNMTTAQLLELWHDHPAQSHLNKLATWKLPGDDAQLAREFRDAVTGLELQWLEQRIGRMQQSYASLAAEERQELMVMQRRRQELIESRKGQEP